LVIIELKNYFIKNYYLYLEIKIIDFDYDLVVAIEMEKCEMCI
jgi:hypothetical protein